MINEKDVLRREEIDFRGILNRFKRGWPVLLICLGGWLFLGMVFQLTFPPRYTAKTSILIDKPRGGNDPASVVSMSSGFIKTEDYFYNNNKVRLRSYPLIRRAVEEIGSVSYYRRGLFNTEIYNSSPIRVELDSTYMSFVNHETPYGAMFKVEFDDLRQFHLEVEGKYAVNKQEFELEGTFSFGEWIEFDKTRFRVLPVEETLYSGGEANSEILGESYGFVIKDTEAVTLDLMTNLDIEPEELESTVFGVSLAGAAPSKQLALLESIGRLFISDHMESKTHTLRLAIEFLEQEIADTEEKLTTSGTEIERYKTDKSITSLNREGTLLLEQMVQMENDKVNFLVKEKYYNYLETFLKESSDYESLISPQAFGVKDQLIIRLTEELVRMQQEMNSIKDMGAENNPVYRQLQSQINTNRSTILRSVTGLKQSNDVMINNINERLNTMRQEASELPKAQRELMEMERFFRVNERLYLSLMEKKADAEITLVSTAPDFQIIDPPHLTSTDPTLPNFPITIIAAIIFGFMFAFAYIMWRWIFNSTLDSAEDVRRHIPTNPVLGEVYHTNISNPFDLQDYPDSTLAQRLYSIHYALSQKNPDAKLIGVGSPQPRNGKSFFSQMFAVRLAMAGYKTILVDANLKNPKAKRAFKLGQSENLIHVLKGDISLDEALIPSGIENLDVADCGEQKQINDKEMARLSDLLKELCQRYDRVILDTSPYMNQSTVLHLLNSSDASIVMLRRKTIKIKTLGDVQDHILEGVLQDPFLVLTDTFDSEVSINIFEKRNNYENNKPLGIFGRIRRVFLRI